MNFIKSLKVFLLTFPIFLGIDFLWIGLIAKDFYDKQLSPFRRALRWPAAFFVYSLLVLGIVIFVVFKAEGDPVRGFVWGAIFGFITYGIYDLTNLATLAEWSHTMVIIDMLWGSIICATTGFIAVSLSNYLG